MFIKSLSLLVLVLITSVNPSKRPLPTWFDKAKFGVMIHWGVYSVPSYGGGTGASEWFWKHWKDYKQRPLIEYMKANFKPDFSYSDFAPQFTAEFYDPDQWVDLIQASGARYAVITTKHHEGFCNWPTNVSFSWRSLDVGPHRDLVGDFVRYLRKKTEIKLGLYHSLYEWFNQLYLLDKSNNFTTNFFSMGKTIPELYELVNLYKPSLIWSDGEWEATANYWNSTNFIKWLYEDSEVKDEVVVNNRWGANSTGPQGDYQSYENQHRVIYKQEKKWENAVTMDTKSWGYRREANLSDYMTSQQIITLLVQAVSMGGNFLLNIGPTADGRILPIFQERLLDTGQWLRVNGEAIYDSVPWDQQIDKLNSNVWYTKKITTNQSAVYAILVADWPENNLLELASPKPNNFTQVSLLGKDGFLNFSVVGNTVTISLPILTPSTQLKFAWTLKFVGLVNS